MPFLGLDWRAPGQNWVRTRKGWEMLLALRENLNTHIKKMAKERYLVLNERTSLAESNQERNNLEVENKKKEDIPELRNNNNFKEENNNNNDNNRMVEMQDRNEPLYLFVRKGPRNLTLGTINLAEVMMKLNFGLVARDPRKFNYVTKVLEFVITQQFSDVSGTTQKHILNVIGQMVNHAVNEMHQNISRVADLLQLVETALVDGKLRHVGSKKVWEKKLLTVQTWRKELSDVEYPVREEDGGMMMTYLPDDCLRQIISRIPNHKDLVNLSATNYKFNTLVNEDNQWKDLCVYHFTEKQIWSALPVDEEDYVDWRKVYQKLNKRHKKKEQYIEKLKLCNRCHCVFWNFGDHPCTQTENDEYSDVEHLQGSRDITPQEFIKLLF